MTPPAELARIAAQRRDLHAALAANPAAYPDLVDWLRHSPDPAVLAALRVRDLFGVQAVDASVAPPPPPPARPQPGVHTTTPDRTIRKGSGRLVALIAAGALVAAVAGAVVVGHRDGDTGSASGGDDSAYTTESGETGTLTPQPDATPTPTSSAPLGTVRWSLKSASGYSEQVAVSVGALITGAQLQEVSVDYASTDDPAGGTVLLSDVCTIDPDSDVAIPVTVTATSTTADFQAYLSYGVRAVDVPDPDYVAPTSLGGDTRFEAASVYSDGDTECNSLTTEGANTVWRTPVDEGRTITDIFYVVVHDYRTPAAPGGDASVLGQVRLIPSSSSASSADDNTRELYAPDPGQPTLALDGTTHSD